MKLYAIAEACNISNGDDDTREYCTEPVVCIPLGVFTSITRACVKCTKLNKEWNRVQGRDGAEDEEHFTVEPIELHQGAKRQ